MWQVIYGKQMYSIYGDLMFAIVEREKSKHLLVVVDKEVILGEDVFHICFSNLYSRGIRLENQDKSKFRGMNGGSLDDIRCQKMGY